MKKLSTVGTTKQSPSLVFCLVMDALGYATYAIPVLGELGDLVWAPISAMIFFKTFGGLKGAFGGVFNFIEELLPGLDFIPTFTITWLIQNFRKPVIQTPVGSTGFKAKATPIRLSRI